MATRTTAEVRRYDIMKLIVTLILIVIIVVLLWRGDAASSPAPTVSPTLAPTDTSAPTEAATATASPTATPLSPTATALPPTATPSPTPTPTPVTIPAPTLILSEREAATAVLHGTGTPGSQVQIVANGKVLAEVTVAADGGWMYTTDLAPGDYDLQARAVNEAGDVVAASEVVAFTQPDATPTPPPTEEVGDGAGEDQAEEEPTSTSSASQCGSGEPPHGEDRGDSYVVAPCEYMALIAKRTGVSLTALIAANPQVTAPALIYPGQVLQLPPR